MSEVPAEVKGPDDYWLKDTFARKYVRNSVLGRRDNKAMKEYEETCLRGFLLGINMLTNGKPRSVLDMGCGHAVRTAQIKALLGCRVVGADYSDAFIGQARTIQEQMPEDHKVDIIKANVYDLPFGDNEFDVAICYGLYMSLSDPQKADLLRVVRYGLVMIEESDAVMSPEQIRAWNDVRKRVYPGRIYWHDYLKLFGRQKSVMFTPVPVPSTWDVGTPPGYARIVVVKEARNAEV